MSATERWANPAAILVATDISDLDRLMPYAFEMATQTGARILLLHVLTVSESVSTDIPGMLYLDPIGAMDSAETAIEHWSKLARTQGLTCETFFRQGNAAQEIVTAVRYLHADRLILGTRSRSKLSKLLVGSVAEQVLRSVSLPVVTVGPEAHLPSGGSNRQKTVLHATTLGETSRPNAALACQIAANQRAKLILLHVLPSMDASRNHGSPGDLDGAVVDELHDLAMDNCSGCCTAVEEEVLHGNPVIEILALAARCDAKLIVLGAMPHSSFQSLIRDRTVYRVLAHARCPVLLLPCPLAKVAEAATDDLVAHG